MDNQTPPANTPPAPSEPNAPQAEAPVSPPPAPSPQSSGMDTNTIIVILLLIFVYPVGLIMMWLLMKKWRLSLKILITSPIILAILLPLLALLLLVIDPAKQLEKARSLQPSITPPVEQTITPTDLNSGTEPEEKMCAADAKRCADGSFVSRTGPNCEFAACPNEVPTQEPLNPSNPTTYPVNSQQ